MSKLKTTNNMLETLKEGMVPIGKMSAEELILSGELHWTQEEIDRMIEKSRERIIVGKPA